MRPDKRERFLKLGFGIIGAIASVVGIGLISFLIYTGFPAEGPGLLIYGITLIPLILGISLLISARNHANEEAWLLQQPVHESKVVVIGTDGKNPVWDGPSEVWFEDADGKCLRLTQHDSMPYSVNDVGIVRYQSDYVVEFIKLASF